MKKIVLCGLFLQLFFIDIALPVSRGVEKAKQSHSSFSCVAKHTECVLKHKKKPANRLVSSRPSGECRRCPKRNNKKHKKRNHSNGMRLTTVSFYDSGQTTSNGESFNPYGMTTAHKTAEFNSRFRVVNPDNGKSVIVRVNDRGPFIKGREFDLSRGAMQKLGLVKEGVARVYVQRVS